MKIAIVSDAWYPQVNGVVRTLNQVTELLMAEGHEVFVIGPYHSEFRTVGCPTYPEIRLVVNARRHVTNMLLELQADAIHIATEGPLGLAARLFCSRRKIPFTTSFHTKFPEYVEARFKISPRITYALLRWFHNGAERTLVSTPSVRQELANWGFKNLAKWTRGVDIELFHPAKATLVSSRQSDCRSVSRSKKKQDRILLYVGRVAIEKNIEAFLTAPVEGRKIIVGKGPHLESFKARYRQHPNIEFVGSKFNEELAQFYADADVFVFPSKTDTFGLVMLEALASGTPVAAYPVSGPIDVITNASVGCLHDNLSHAIEQAYALGQPDACRAHAETFSWQNCLQMFRDNLASIAKSKYLVNRTSPAATRYAYEHALTKE